MNNINHHRASQYRITHPLITKTITVVKLEIKKAANTRRITLKLGEKLNNQLIEDREASIKVVMQLKIILIAKLSMGRNNNNNSTTTKTLKSILMPEELIAIPRNTFMHSSKISDLTR